MDHFELLFLLSLLPKCWCYRHLYHIQSLLFKKRLYLFIYVYEYFACVYFYVLLVCSVSVEVRRGY